MSDAPGDAEVRAPRQSWRLSAALCLLTFLSTSLVSAWRKGADPLSDLNFAAGFGYSVPLMAILLAHEFGHFFAGMYHRIDVSPPYFIPVPFFLLGTLGAVIQMRERIRSRNALLDIGASGPLCGMAIAVPVVIYGLATSPVQPLPEAEYFIEGRSILYLAILYGLKGPIATGYDISLNPTALAGWAGLLITMINLLPFGQLDGGHIAYALLGPRQNRVSSLVLRLLPIFAVVIGLAYGVPSYLAGSRGDPLIYDVTAGMHWLIWAVVLWLLTRATGPGHPPTEDTELTPRRRMVGWLTLSLFVLLFMPSWIRIQ